MRTCPHCGMQCPLKDTRCRRCGELLSVSIPHAQGASAPLPFAQESLKSHIGNYTQVRPLESLKNTYIIEKDDQQFILKHFLPLNTSSTAIREIFLRECQVFSNLSYTGLPKVIKYFIQDVHCFLLLDSPIGISLSECISSDTREASLHSASKLPLFTADRILQWTVELAEVILYLHEQKPFPVLHRNLTPVTVRVTQPDSHIRLVDFGLLNTVRTSSSSERDGHSVLMQDTFAAPDVLKIGWSDPRSDIYSFGKILDFIFSHPHIIRLFDEEIRSQLIALATRCCDPSPEKRYQRMVDVLTDLTRLHEPTTLEMHSAYCSCGYATSSTTKFCERCGLLMSQDIQENGSGSPVGIPSVSYDVETQVLLLSRYQQGFFAPFPRFRMREALDAVQSDPGFDELISLESLPLVTKLPHQKEAALNALKRMRGRVLLADEVGLGKTIEAGIILKELIMRRLASRVLIFCPVQLLGQWQSELYEKFGEIFLVLGRDIDTSLAWHCPRLIVPYGVAQRRLHVEEMLRHHYDLIILDEAHYLNAPDNERILLAMKNLQKKYFLLLSATPMHNSLEELYNIITLLKPGHFDDLESFKTQFIDPENLTRILNAERLRSDLRQVMIRHNRKEVTLEHPFPERDAHTVLLALDPSAITFYNDFREFYRCGLEHVSNRQLLLRMGEVVERLCSSSEAFRKAVNPLERDRYVQKYVGPKFIHEFRNFSAKYPPSLIEPKIRATLDWLQRFIFQGEKVLVFSQFNETTKYIYRRACRTELREYCSLYDEDDPHDKKMKSLRDLSKSNAGVLFCPGEASEGLNLQFANVMINFDLPWDPMKIEQRIGRIQRIGGKQKIIIVNMILKGTIEEEILKICEDKINMFGQVIGQVEEILGNMREEDDFRTMLTDVYLKRDVENEEGERVSAEEHLMQALEEAQRLASEQEASLLEDLGTITFDDDES